MNSGLSSVNIRVEGERILRLNLTRSGLGLPDVTPASQDVTVPTAKPRRSQTTSVSIYCTRRGLECPHREAETKSNLSGVSIIEAEVPAHSVRLSSRRSQRYVRGSPTVYPVHGVSGKGSRKRRRRQPEVLALTDH